MKKLPACTVIYLEALLEVLPEPSSFKIFGIECTAGQQTEETTRRIKNPVLSRLIVGLLK
jgi:hypothetical protein